MVADKGNTAAPVGTVQFAVDGTALGGPVTVQNGRAASPGIATLAAGSHAVQATFSGSTNFAASSGTLTQSVGADATAVQVSSSVNPSDFGQDVVATATVTGLTAGGRLPEGTMTFSVDGTPVCPQATVVQGVASCDLGAALGVGPHTVVAAYSGDSDFKPSQGQMTQQVSPAATSTQLTVTSNPSTYGQAVTLHAAVSALAPGAGSPGGEMMFEIDGTVVATAPVTGGSANSRPITGLDAGSHVAVAIYAGSADFTGSQDHQGLIVQRTASSIAVTSSIEPSTYGQSVSFTAQVDPTGGALTGTVQFLVDNSPLGAPVTLQNGGARSPGTSSLAAGWHTVTAKYSGDDNFLPSSQSTLQAVRRAPTTLALTSSKAPSVFGDSLTYTARLSVMAPGAGFPTGAEVQFFIDGRAVGGLVPLQGDQAVSEVVNGLSGGDHQVVVSFQGTADYDGSSDSLGQRVTPAPTSVSVSSTPNPSTGGSSVLVSTHVTSAAGDPPGSVQLLIDGQPQGPLVALRDGSVTFPAVTGLRLGAHTFEVSYGGTVDYGASNASLVQQVMTSALPDTGLLWTGWLAGGLGLVLWGLVLLAFRRPRLRRRR